MNTDEHRDASGNGKAVHSVPLVPGAAPDSRVAGGKEAPLSKHKLFQLLRNRSTVERCLLRNAALRDERAQTGNSCLAISLNRQKRRAILDVELRNLWVRYWMLSDPNLMKQCLAVIARAMALRMAL